MEILQVTCRTLQKTLYISYLFAIIVNVVIY